MAELLNLSGSFKVTGSNSNYIDGQLGLGTSSPGVQLEVIGTVSGSSVSTGSFGRVEGSTLSGDGSAITGVTAEWDGTHTGDGTITGNFNVTGNITGSNFSGSSSSTASFGRVEGTVDFGDIVIDADEIPIAKLASDNVNFGGITVALGASDATPAFDLSDATAYTGDSSLVTTGTVTSGIWNSTFGSTANTIISGSSTSTGSFGHVSVAGVLKTGDIELENKRGHWKIVEESEYLSITNVNTNKKYKILMEEIE